MTDLTLALERELVATIAQVSQRQRHGGAREIGEEREIFKHERLGRDDWGNRVFDTLPDGGLLVSVQQESNVVLRVVLGFDGE